MKAICLTADSGYERTLTEGKEYEITDIQGAIFSGEYYAIGIGNEGKKFACHLYRFNISKEFAAQYVQENPSE